MTDTEAHWEQVWETRDHEETSWFQTDPEVSLAIIDALGVTPERGFIDVGCGASHLVDRLLGRGVREIHLLDVSARALAQVKSRLGGSAGAEGVRYHAVDLLDLDPAPVVDVWHDRAMLHFLREAADRRTYAEVATTAVRSGGVLIVGGFAPDGPERCSDLEVCRSDADGIAELFSDGFELIHSDQLVHVTPWGADQMFQWCALRRI